MCVDKSDKIDLIEQRVGARLAPLGFSAGAKTCIDVEFSRTVEGGVRQTVLVTHSRHADMVCARYFSSNAFMPVQAAGMVLDFVRERCPWARPAEGEWVWYDGDGDFPNAVDKLVFMIEGVGLDVLGMLSSASEEDARAARERAEAEGEPPAPGRPLAEAVPPRGREVALGLSRAERTALVESVVGAALLPLGFSFDGWDDFSDWDFHRFVRGDFDVIATDRRGLFVAGSDTAEQRVVVDECPGIPLVGVGLGTNTFYPGGRDLEIKRSFAARAAADHPDMFQGMWFAYRDDASYADALGKIADVLARYGEATLDALCEREGGGAE